jgi:threonine aldolase
MNGVRLFKAVVTGANSLREYGELRDTLTVDFSKDLGATMRAMLLGDNALITQAHRIRKERGQWPEAGWRDHSCMPERRRRAI